MAQLRWQGSMSGISADTGCGMPSPFPPALFIKVSGKKNHRFYQRCFTKFSPYLPVSLSAPGVCTIAVRLPAMRRYRYCLCRVTRKQSHRAFLTHFSALPYIFAHRQAFFMVRYKTSWFLSGIIHRDITIVNVDDLFLFLSSSVACWMVKRGVRRLPFCGRWYCCSVWCHHG